jgi:hypothetical protein
MSVGKNGADAGMVKTRGISLHHSGRAQGASPESVATR